MAAVMKDSHNQKLRLPSISTIKSLQLLSTGELPPPTPTQGRLPSFESIAAPPPPNTQPQPSASQTAPLHHGQQQTLQAPAEVLPQRSFTPSSGAPPTPIPPINNLALLSSSASSKRARSPSSSPRQMIETPTLIQVPSFPPPPHHIFVRTPSYPPQKRLSLHENTIQPQLQHEPPQQIYYQQHVQPGQPVPYPVAYYNSYTAVPHQEMTEAIPLHQLAQNQALQSQGQGLPLTRVRKIRPVQVCQRCGITETPEWRKGPNGSRTLCNACGLLYAKVLKREGPDAAAFAIMNSTVKKRRSSYHRGTPSYSQQYQFTPQHNRALSVPGPQSQMVIQAVPQAVPQTAPQVPFTMHQQQEHIQMINVQGMHMVPGSSSQMMQQYERATPYILQPMPPGYMPGDPLPVVPQRQPNPPPPSSSTSTPPPPPQIAGYHQRRFPPHGGSSDMPRK